MDLIYKIYFFIFNYPIRTFFILILIVSVFSFIEIAFFTKMKKLDEVTQYIIQDSQNLQNFIDNTKSKEDFLSKKLNVKDLLKKIIEEYPLKLGLNFGKPEYTDNASILKKDFKIFLKNIAKVDKDELLKTANSCKIVDSKSKMECYVQKMSYVLKFLIWEQENACKIDIIYHKAFYDNFYDVIYFAFYDDEYDDSLKKESYIFSQMYYMTRYIARKVLNQCFGLE